MLLCQLAVAYIHLGNFDFAVKLSDRAERKCRARLGHTGPGAAGRRLHVRGLALLMEGKDFGNTVALTLSSFGRLEASPWRQKPPLGR